MTPLYEAMMIGKRKAEKRNKAQEIMLNIAGAALIGLMLFATAYGLSAIMEWLHI